MLTESGPKVLEYNVRFGDPETEALMLLLSDDTDLAVVLLVCRNFMKLKFRIYIPQACAERRLDSVEIKTRPGFAVSVVLASQGYPGTYPKGKEIKIEATPPGKSSVSDEVTPNPDSFPRCCRFPRWHFNVK